MGLGINIGNTLENTTNWEIGWGNPVITREYVDSLAALLRLEGHEVRVARDGPSAVAVASRFEPDVALLDIGLPGMSGYDVSRALRADARTSHCLLVALSGWGQDADRRRSREAGFDRHLVKPLDIGLFNELLEHAPSERSGSNT